MAKMNLRKSIILSGLIVFVLSVFWASRQVLPTFVKISSSPGHAEIFIDGNKDGNKSIMARPDSRPASFSLNAPISN